MVEALTITNMVKSAKGTVDRPGKNVAQKSGLNRSISGEAWGRTVTLLAVRRRLSQPMKVEMTSPCRWISCPA